MISCKVYWFCKEPGHVDYANLLCVFQYLPSYIPCCVLPLVSSRMAKMLVTLCEIHTLGAGLADITNSIMANLLIQKINECTWKVAP